MQSFHHVGFIQKHFYIHSLTTYSIYHLNFSHRSCLLCEPFNLALTFKLQCFLCSFLFSVGLCGLKVHYFGTAYSLRRPAYRHMPEVNCITTQQWQGQCEHQFSNLSTTDACHHTIIEIMIITQKSTKCINRTVMGHAMSCQKAKKQVILTNLMMDLSSSGLNLQRWWHSKAQRRCKTPLHHW